MSRRIWLQQPLAFARVGSSTTPLSAFRWTQPDLRPRGSGRTTIAPANTLIVDPAGAGKWQSAGELTQFKDAEGIRPVSPFFELHGDWDGTGKDVPVSLQLLEKSGLSLSDLTWSIRYANCKAFAYTGCRGDRIESDLIVNGDDHDVHELIGRSPEDAKHPLVPRGCGIPMGALQAVKPDSNDEPIRLRFHAPKGHAYGPTNLNEVINRKSGLGAILALFNPDWAGFRLPEERCFLNPDAAWPKFKLVTWGQVLRAFVTAPWNFWRLRVHAQRSELVRFLLGPTGNGYKLPPVLFAWRYGGGAPLSNLGLIDDLGDGIITCTLKGVGRARARIVVCPPHFAPDRRPPVSIADNLTDRTRRADVRSLDWTAKGTWPQAEAEIDDLLERAFETAALSNLDAWNVELGEENKSNALYRGDRSILPDLDGLLWPDLAKETVAALPLTDKARWHHRRNAADELFEQLVRDRPDLLDKYIRNPDDDNEGGGGEQGAQRQRRTSLYYDQRMPALMRGADRRPLHLTRRQLEALRKWAEQLREREREKPR